MIGVIGLSGFWFKLFLHGLKCYVRFGLFIFQGLNIITMAKVDHASTTYDKILLDDQFEALRNQICWRG